MRDADYVGEEGGTEGNVASILNICPPDGRPAYIFAAALCLVKAKPSLFGYEF